MQKNHLSNLTRTASDMSSSILKELAPEEVRGQATQPVPGAALTVAEEIIARVRNRGLTGLLEYCRRFGDLGPEDQLLYTRDDLDAALRRVDSDQRQILQRTADRIRNFATAQREMLQDGDLPVQGGRAGWRYFPVGRAGCYAPGGRFPLPSSVLMTAVTARVAGVREVWVASPGPVDMTLAAAAVAGADVLVAAGGAQAIAALAYGVEGIGL